MYSNTARRAIFEVIDPMRSTSDLMVAKNDSATALSQQSPSYSCFVGTSPIKAKFVSIAALMLFVLMLGGALLQWSFEYHNRKLALNKLALDYDQKVAVPTRITPGSPSSDYMLEVQRRIKAVWHPPHVRDDAASTFTFNIHKSGEIFDERVNKSSGSKAFDEAALAALRDASPVQSLPGAVAPEDANVEFTFTYHSHTWPATLFGWLFWVPPMHPILGWFLVTLTALSAFGLLWCLYKRELTRSGGIN